VMSYEFLSDEWNSPLRVIPNEMSSLAILSSPKGISLTYGLVTPLWAKKPTQPTGWAEHKYMTLLR
jgi:hypothetical protein